MSTLFEILYILILQIISLCDKIKAERSDTMNRIAELRKRAGLSQAEFGKMMGAAQNTVSNWEKGNREPDNGRLKVMSEYFGVTIDYLLGNDAASPRKPKKKGVRIPVLGRVQAGIPVTATEEILDYEEITEDLAETGEFFALKVRGHSMEPKLLPDDVLIIRMQQDVDDGDIAVVLVNGDDATVKKIKKSQDGVLLVPFNPEFDPIFYSNQEIEDLPVRVLGKVIELRRTL